MKKYLLLLAAMFLATAGFAQKAAILNRIDSKEDFEKKSHDVKERFINKKSSDIIQYRDSEIESTTILKEDFSKFTEGSEDVSKIEDYHSHNTRRLDVEGMKEQLMRLRFIQEDLGLLPRAKARDIRSE